MPQGKLPAEPEWPSHRDDAPPAEDPRSLRRGITAGAAVVMLTLALAAVGPWSTQAGGTLLALGWIAAVGFGTLAYRGRPPYVLTLTKVALVAGVAALALALLFWFVGLQVRAVLEGTVVFGTGGEGCTVDGNAEVFSPGQPSYQVAHPSRTVEAGEPVTLTLRDGDVEVARGSNVTDAAFDCLGAPLEPLPPGAYEVTLSVRGEVLAEGRFEVVAGE